MKILIKKLNAAAQVPVYASAGAACFDLHAIENGNVHHANSGNFRTGLAFEIPDGHVMLIFSRSGHGFKHATRLANCVGVIDSDYRGEVAVKLTCDGMYGENLPVKAGDRIAQAMVVPVDRVEFELVDELSSTERGAGGFGHTGN